jgi:hypothetical protein
MRRATICALIVILFSPVDADAGVVRLRIERRETVLNGRPFGAAGPYEKLVGKVDFALDTKPCPVVSSTQNEARASKPPRPFMT